MRNHFLRAAAGNAAGPSITFNEYQIDTTNSSSYSFTGVDIGTAAADRLVVVVALCAGTSFSTNISDVTIAGTSGSLVIAENGPNYTSHEIWARQVSSGTTATIGVSASATAGRCFIVVYSLYGLDSYTAVDTGSGSNFSSSTTDTLTGLDAGSLVIAAAQQSGSGTDISNVTKDIDDLSLESGARNSTVGNAKTTTSGNFSITYTLSSSNTSTFVSAAFR